MILENKVIQASIKPLTRFINENPRSIGIVEKVVEVKMKALGHGESNISILAKVNDKYLFVIRIAQLKKDGVEKEFEILEKVPNKLGPEPIYINTSKKVIPYPFLIESFVSGKNITDWTEENLSMLAKSLALLHSKTATIKNENISFSTKLKSDNNYFLKNNLSLSQDHEIASVLNNILQYLDTKEKLLVELKQLSLIHGDLNSSNIYLDEKNNIKFIDWELAHYNDPAREFSTFYYDDMKYLDWRIHLKSPHREKFLLKYMKRADIQDKHFEDRVKVWQIVDKAGAFIYCKWKALTAKHKNEKLKFDETANLLKNSLEKAVV